MTNILNRLMRDEKKDIVHSSGFAKAQNGDSMGAASGESFKRRQNIEKSRQVIRSYGDSRIAHATQEGIVRAKQELAKSNNAYQDNGVNSASGNTGENRLGSGLEGRVGDYSTERGMRNGGENRFISGTDRRTNNRFSGGIGLGRPINSNGAGTRPTPSAPRPTFRMPRK